LFEIIAFVFLTTMGCCTSNDKDDADGQLVVFDDKKELQIDPQIILPAEDKTQSQERERFMTTVSVEDAQDGEVDDAIIMLPPRRMTGAISLSTVGESSPKTSDGEFTHFHSTNTSDAELQKARAQRIGTMVDVYNLDNWWGMSPGTPDKRLSASMPGHAVATEVEEVMVKKAESIQTLRDELPLDQLCRGGEKYILFQLKLGKVCLLSLHHVTDHDTYEKVLSAQGVDLLKDSLKMIVIPVNLKISVPVKGPKEADTIGSFFGSKNVNFSRSTVGKFDIALLSLDLYSVWSLKMLLPSVAFKAGRMVDFHVVSWRDNAVLLSYRAAMTPQVCEIIKNIGVA
jgi:hypothetical protein